MLISPLAAPHPSPSPALPAPAGTHLRSTGACMSLYARRGAEEGGAYRSGLTPTADSQPLPAYRCANVCTSVTSTAVAGLPDALELRLACCNSCFSQLTVTVRRPLLDGYGAS